MRLNTFGGNKGDRNAPAAPIMIHTADGNGWFQISNPVVDAIYTTTLVSGTAGITPSASNKYFMTNTNTRYSITASWYVGGPESAPGYMERKPHAFGPRLVSATCGYSCNCHTEGVTCFCAAPDGGGCPPGTSPNGQCGCGGAAPCMGGSLGYTVCDTCYSDCSYYVYDVLINEPGYTNSGGEWYKVT